MRKGKVCKACGGPMTQMITTGKHPRYVWICNKIKGEPMKGTIGLMIYCDGDKRE